MHMTVARGHTLLMLIFGAAVVATACTGDGLEPERNPLGTTMTVPSASATATTTTELGTGASTLPLNALELILVQVGSGFDAPVLLVADPSGGADLVVEQSGRIVRNDPDHSIVLDIRSDVTFGGEQGLLGLAFHPRFDENALVYVNYIDRSQSTVIEEFTVSDGLFNLDSRRPILTIEQPAANHNGGMIAFGPEGYLWIGMGDGGSANDRFGNGQDSHTLLGAMLRIEVGHDQSEPYAIPTDNPFADGSGGAPEVWAFGLRNPWRFSFDGDDLWIADVGQDDVEEVNAVSSRDAGLNYGWPVMEGSTCFRSADCDVSTYVLPATEYTHDEGCSITGGYVYRGDAIPELRGQYFFADFCVGFVRSFSPATGVHDWTDALGESSRISGFGIGAHSELSIASHDGGIYRIERAP